MTNETYTQILEYFHEISAGTKWEGHLFAVGGCVRDEILGAEIKDVDIAVDLPNGGVGFAKWLHKKRQVIGVPVFFHKFGTAKLRLRRFPDEEIELVQTRAEKYTKKNSRCPEVVSGTLQEDCFRRDFTVNTLYRNIQTGEILDMTGRGVHDIKAGIIRTPMDPYETFDDDPVRILRCLRFAARFGWDIDSATMEALRQSVGRLAIVSRERWSAEFQKMLFGRNLRRSLGTLQEIGGLKFMNSTMREFDQKKENKNGPSLLKAGLEAAIRLEEAGIDNHAMRLAAFFHDLGKLRTGVRDRHGNMRFPKHEITGSNMAAKLLKLMKVDHATIEETKSLIHTRRLKIVIAPDSFKGSLSAREVADAAAEGILRVVPNAEVVKIPLADGGEGTSEILSEFLSASKVVCTVDDPLGRPAVASYAIAGDGKESTAIMDMASASGHALLAPDELNPLSTSTYGTGQMIADAYDRGCRRFIIGIGGSATSDVGMGMMSALGAKFIGPDGNPISPKGESMRSVRSIDLTSARKDILDCEFTIVSDVNNPLCGVKGAARVFAPQKGATPEEVEILEQGAEKFRDVILEQTGRDVADVPGAGAAGGLGAAFLAFFPSATLKSGVDTILDMTGFDATLEGADLVITGEGKIDSQTLYGKLPKGVCDRASSKGVRTVAISGVCSDTETLLKAGFAGIFPILQHPMPMEEAMRPDITRKNIAATAASIANLWSRRALTL